MERILRVFITQGYSNITQNYNITFSYKKKTSHI